MKTWQIACIIGVYAIIGAVALTAISQFAGQRPSAAPPDAIAQWEADVEPTGSLGPTGTSALFEADWGAVAKNKAADEPVEEQQAKLEDDSSPSVDASSDAMLPKQDLSYLVYYVYSEVPPERKPADIALDALKDIPIGTPVEEVKRAAAIFGLDVSFMKSVAKIESDFDPKQRTGSYIGLFQLSHYEFDKYGSGDITNSRDNAIAAAYKFVTEAVQFEWATHRKPTFSDLYLIHQQGWQGAAEHVAHPERIAWQSMCATDEGRDKGEKWCKRAIWGNTLPDVKHVWKSVDKLTSGAFVTMWRQRVDHFYARYAATVMDDVKQ